VKNIIKYLAVGIASMLAIQLIPYGKTHSNPPVIKEPHWNSPETRALAKKACYDCHSNESIWPWYTRIAPVSWLISYDVQEGRNKLNFSEWQGTHREGESAVEIAKEIREGEMPPFQYRLVHPSARLSENDKKLLIEGLQLTENNKAKER
jgi:hypothetical protein